MEEEGLVARESSIDSGDETESGYLGTKSLLASDEPVTAILAGNDPTAHGVYKALRDRGSEVPDDISVVDLRARDQQAPLQSDSSGALAPAEDSFLTPEAIQAIVDPWLTDDPVFGQINDLSLEAFFDPEKIADARGEVTGVSQGIVWVVGTGAAIVVENYDLLIYADMARWEIQQRQRSGAIGNLGADNLYDEPLLKYKRSFFIDWRLCDRLKRKLLPTIKSGALAVRLGLVSFQYQSC